MDPELLTCLLKFIEYFPHYLSALSRTLLRFFWTTFVETAVYTQNVEDNENNRGQKYPLQGVTGFNQVAIKLQSTTENETEIISCFFT